VASGDRERELQRQLTQAGLQAEALLEGSQAAAAAESEDLVKGLIQQRDTANDALVVSYYKSCRHVALRCCCLLGLLVLCCYLWQTPMDAGSVWHMSQVQ
jgi:hypothetical protein